MPLRIAPIVKKEFRQLFRDRRSLGVIFFLPLFLLVMFGYAISLDVKGITLAVCDYDGSRESRSLIEAFRRTEHFLLKTYVEREAQIDGLLARERIKAALVIPRAFGRSLSAGRPAAAQLILDGTNPTHASTALGYAEAIVRSFSQRILLERRQAPVAREEGGLDFRPRFWFNPELKSSSFLVPGLISFLMVVTAVISTALSVVREKERGTLEQILISPIRPLELILGKTVPYILISLGLTAGILAASRILFDLPIRGSLSLLAGVTLLFLTGCLGLGILISTAAQTQQVAFLIAVIVTLLPSFLLSGFVFPIRNMPAVIRLLTFLFPARYYIAALRGIILKGAGIAVLWDQILGMVLFAAAVLALSVARLKRQGRGK